MENNHTHSELKKQTLEFSVTDFLNSDSPQFDFKPINDGLGFHKESEIKTTMNPSKAFEFEPQMKSNEGNLVSQYRISPAPHVKKANAQTKVNPRQEHKKSLQKVSLVSQTASGIIDLLVVALSTVALMRLLSIGSALQGIKDSPLDLKTHWGFGIGFFSIIWISYSTFLGPAQTIGQTLTKTKLTFVKDPYMSSFIRSLIVLSSFICFLIPLFFDFQGKLSDSELVND